MTGDELRARVRRADAILREFNRDFGWGIAVGSVLGLVMAGIVILAFGR